jgi:hypothetical protein
MKDLKVKQGMKVVIEIPKSLIKVCKQYGLNDQYTSDFFTYFVTQPEMVLMMEENLKMANKQCKRGK